MRLLLGSGGFRTDGRVRFLSEQMKSFFGPVERILFIPYALKDHDRYLELIAEKRLDGGYRLDGVHRHSHPRQAVREAEALYIGGGNTFWLLSELYRLELLEPIRERVRAGIPYLGISAGANVACPTIRTTNDMPVVTPPRMEALELVPFQINTHYYPGRIHYKDGSGYQEHFGETRHERINEFHESNDTPVVGLGEGGILRIEDDKALLLGATARIFHKGREPLDVFPGSPLIV
jgi:dipeptidase E